MLILPAVSYAKEDGTSFFFSTFEGPKHLAKNVAALMSLEIGHKLQGSDFFEDKTIRWKIANIKISNHEQALVVARHNNTNFVLWGAIFHYGTAFIIQPYLSILNNSQKANKVLGVWQETIQIKNKNITISTDNPEFNPANRPIVFSPIILNQQIAQKYSSPNALRFYTDKKSRIGTDEFIISKFKGRSVWVKSQGKAVKLDLPMLSAREIEIFNFVAGMLMLFENNWIPGIERLQSIEQIKGTPTALKIGSLLFRADAKVKSGFGASPILEKAYSINPYYKPTIAYKIVNEFSDLNKLLNKPGEVDEKRKKILSIAKLINSNRYLFPPNDQWFKNIQYSLNILEAEYFPNGNDIKPVEPPPDIVNSSITPIKPDSSRPLWTAGKQANIQEKIVFWEGAVHLEDSRFARVFISRKAIQMDGNKIQLVFRGNKLEDYFISMVSIAQKLPDGKIGEIVESTWKKIYFDSKEKELAWDNKIFVPPLSNKKSMITSFEFSKNADYYVTFFIEGPSDFLRYYSEEETASENETSLFFYFSDKEQDKTYYAEKKNWLYEESDDTDYKIIALDSIEPGYDTIQLPADDADRGRRI